MSHVSVDARSRAEVSCSSSRKDRRTIVDRQADRLGQRLSLRSFVRSIATLGALSNLQPQ